MKRFLLLIALLPHLACNDRTLPTASDLVPAVARIEISPDPIRIEEGQSVLLRVVALDAADRVIERSLMPSWRVSNPDLAEVSLAGRLVARKPGAATVTATIDGLEARASLTVLASPAATLTLYPSDVRMNTDQNTSLFAIVRDSAGNALGERRIFWSSSAPEIASVDSTGRVEPHRAGNVTIKARSGLAVGEAKVTILWGKIAGLEAAPRDTTIFVGDRIQLGVTAWDAKGNQIEDVETVWSSVDPNIVVVTPTGLARGVGEGVAHLRVTAGDAEASMFLIVETPSGGIEGSQP